MHTLHFAHIDRKASCIQFYSTIVQLERNDNSIF